MDQDEAGAQAVLAAISSRRSVRAFRGTPVPQDMIETILTAAARAPSANNTQPWLVHVLTGGGKAQLTAAILQDRADGAPEPAPEYPYAPEHWVEPYLSRRRKVGWDLYSLLGIVKGDHAAGRAWHDANFDFFGAPVGMIFTIDRRLRVGAFMDVSLFMQNVMTAARGMGLDSCAQAAFAGYHATIRRVLALPDEHLVVCGLALGWADPDALPNRLHTAREPLTAFARFLD